jgi:alpha/beta hydrolase family protein
MNFESVSTQMVDVNGTPFAYREIGEKHGVPLVLLHHLTAVLDDWDPRVVDGLAFGHHVIAFDNRGVGKSGGTTPRSVEEMAHDAISFIRAFGKLQAAQDHFLALRRRTDGRPQCEHRNEGPEQDASQRVLLGQAMSVTSRSANSDAFAKNGVWLLSNVRKSVLFAGVSISASLTKSFCSDGGTVLSAVQPM